MYNRQTLLAIVALHLVHSFITPPNLSDSDSAQAITNIITSDLISYHPATSLPLSTTPVVEIREEPANVTYERYIPGPTFTGPSSATTISCSPQDDCFTVMSGGVISNMIMGNGALICALLWMWALFFGMLGIVY